MAKLVLHRAGGEMRDIPLDQDRVTIGRRADHDVCLPFPAVSADHAEIVTVMGDSFLHDLGSTNGPFVNGERETKHFLRDHDRIDIGRQQLVYVMNDAEQVEPLPVEKSDPMAGGAEPVPSATVTQIAAVPSPRGESSVEADVRIANVDDLMTDLMEMNSDASAAVEMPPSINVRSRKESARNGHGEFGGAV